MRPIKTPTAQRSAAASGPVVAAVAPPASPAGTPAAGTRVAGVSGSRRAGVAAPVVEAGADAGPRPGDIFQDCDVCPEMVVLPDGGLALGRYEVLVGEYRAFAAATGSGAVGHCVIGDSWQEPRFPQTDRHPVTCVNWNDAQALRVVAEPDGAGDVSTTDRGGMGTGSGGVGGRMCQPRRRRGYLSGWFIGCQPSGAVRHGRESVGVDGELLGGRLRPACLARRLLGQR